MPKTQSIVQQLRAAVKASDKSRYRIAKDTGLSEAAMSRFMAGKNEPKLVTAEKIAHAVGFRIVLMSDT